MRPVDGGQTGLALGAAVDFVAVLILCEEIKKSGGMLDKNSITF